MVRHTRFPSVIGLLLLMVGLMVAAPAQATTGQVGGSATVESSASERLVEKLYLAFLRREPDAQELAAGVVLVDDGRWSDVMEELAINDEWLGRFVDDTYQRVLDRDPDEAGRAYWIEQLKSGLTTADILYPILRSDEFAAANAAGDAEVVGRLVRQILGREVGTGGSTYWVSVAAEHGAGVVADSLFASAEYRRLLVEELYDRLLCRDADEAGHAYWADQLPLGGELELARTFVASTEFHAMARGCGSAPTFASEGVTVDMGGLAGINSDGSTVMMYVNGGASFIDTASGEATVVTTASGLGPSSDGTKHVFEDGTDLILVDVETETTTTLDGVSHEDHSNIVLSNSGVFYRSYVVGTRRIERYDPATETLTEIYTTADSRNHAVLAASGDGQRALLVLESETTKLQLWDNGTLKPITSIVSTTDWVNPRMNHDGSTLVVITGTGSPRGFQTVDLVNDIAATPIDIDEAVLESLKLTKAPDQILHSDPASFSDPTTLRTYDMDLTPTGRSVDLAGGAQLTVNSTGTIAAQLTATGPNGTLTIHNID